MTHYRILQHLLVGLSAISLLTGATAGVSTEPQTQAAPVQRAQSPGKPSAGLAITSGSRYHLAAGSVQTLTLHLSSAVKEGTLHLTLATSDPALELLSPQSHQFDLAEDATPELALELLPHGDGSFYLMLNAEIAREGAPAQAQALGVAVQVGKKADAQLRKAKPPKSGVISLPAKETIR